MADLTNEQIEAGLKACEAVPPGDWGFDSYCRIMAGEGEIVAYVPTEYGDTAGPQGIAVAHFICQASTLLPAALSELPRLRTANARLNELLGCLQGTVRTYINSDPQVRGEAFREMQETSLMIAGEREDLTGWPGVCHRLEDKIARLEAELAALKGGNRE